MSGGKKVKAEKEERGEKAEKKLRVLQRRREAGIVRSAKPQRVCAPEFSSVRMGGACRLYSHLTF